MPPLLQAGTLTPMPLHPTVSAVQIPITADALEGGVVIADYAPGGDFCVCVGGGWGGVLGEIRGGG